MLYFYNVLNIFRKMKSFRFYGDKNKNTTPASLSRILDLAENDPLSHKNEDDQIKITIVPPTNATGDITDKDGTEIINNLPGSMLLASAEVDRERNRVTEDDAEPAKKKPKKKPIHQSGTGSTPTWPVTRLPANAHMDEIKAKKLSPLGYFKLFFDDELTDLIVVETNPNSHLYLIQIRIGSGLVWQKHLDVIWHQQTIFSCQVWTHFSPIWRAHFCQIWL